MASVQKVEHSSRYKYFSAAIFANALWGFMVFPLRNLTEWPSDTILFFRVFSALFFIWLYIFLFGRASFMESVAHFKSLSIHWKKKFIVLLLLCSFLILGNWFTFIYAINRVSISSAAFAYLVCPLITTLAGYFLLKERISSIKWLSLGIALLSIAILGHTSLVGVLWSITIASFYAFYLVIQRILKDFNKFHFLAIQLLVSAIYILPLMFYQQVEVPLDLEFWGNISVIGLIFTVIPLFLSMYALNGLPSSTMGVLIYFNPIISFLLAVSFFNEKINLLEGIAYLLLLFAILLYNSDLLKQIFTKLARA